MRFLSDKPKFQQILSATIHTGALCGIPNSQMNKTKLLFIFLLLIVSKIYSQNTEQFTFNNLLIKYETGDESRELYQIKVIRVGNSYQAEKTLPFYYIGTKYDSIWKTTLNNQQLKKVKKFIEISKSLPSSCPIESLSIDNYLIKVDDTEYKIEGHCNWKNLDYSSLEKILFNKQFDELQIKRDALEDSLNNSLNGLWVVSDLEGLKKNDTIILRKTPNSQIGKVVWHFSNNYIFHSSKNEVFDLTHSINYQLLITSGHIVLKIGPGVITNAKGYSTVSNYGANFEIINFNTEEIKLKFRWR